MYPSDAPKSLSGFVVAGERSGVGKTMITLALAAALKQRGRVQCFKTGPDFIDPGFHTLATGRVSRNLDGWMMGRQACLSTFARGTRDADFAVVEGVMGLFDGCDGQSEDGSTAQIAKWLGLPVVLVIDGSSLARTAGALVLGLEQFDPQLSITGVICNRVAGSRHFEYLKTAIEDRCAAAVLGYIPRDPAWQTPERHLGLVTAAEQDDLAKRIEHLSRKIAETVDIEQLLHLLPAQPAPCDCSPPAPQTQVRIGVARDEAFCFYYEDNLDLLRSFGAEIVFFSPLRDRGLPENIQGLYLGGGYPELHAGTLAANAGMLSDIAAFCRSNRPVYAECGGFLYLLHGITGQQGRRHAMAGILPAEAAMRPRLQRLGYVEAEATADCPLLAAGQTIRGHEFHYSDISELPADIPRCYRLTRRRNDELRSEGYLIHNVLAGYLHLHFASNPEFARSFIEQCRSETPPCR